MKKSDRISVRETLSLHLRAAKDVNRIAPGLFLSSVLSSSVKALSPYATIWLSAQLINELAAARRADVLMKWALFIVAVTALLGLASAALGRWHAALESGYYKQYSNLYIEKFLNMDYADADNQKVRDLFTQIQQSANWGGWGFNYMDMYVCWNVEAIAGILGAITLTVSLFTQHVPETTGALTALNHPLFIAGIVGVILAVTLISPALRNKANAAWGSLAEESRFGNRLFTHFTYQICQDAEKAMDIRMYRQSDIAEHYAKTGNTFGVGSHFARLNQTSIGLSQAAAAAISTIMSGLVYVFVCLKAWAGAFGMGSVTQYVGAVTALSGNLSSLLQNIGHMQTNAGFLKTAYEFLDIPNAMYQGSLTTEKRADRQYEVEFRDVSFKYPGSELWALRHVNMKFKVGSRLAIVGENGSGKTTFIKLLCRLYDPQEGQILLNGIDIRKYRYDDYMNIFSVVFQDFQLICQPLGANVAGSMTYNRELVTKALTDAGFGDRLCTMEKGLDTMLYKDLTEDGVDISGGEAQKIAIARALYKDAPFIILDEPTAALDPIAEAEIYAKFNDIAGDKTAIYISHRLSSCKFCDEIAVFCDGAVIQQGTHEALVADEQGKYFHLWNAQAQYYTE